MKKVLTTLLVTTLLLVWFGAFPLENWLREQKVCSTNFRTAEYLFLQFEELGELQKEENLPFGDPGTAAFDRLVQMLVEKDLLADPEIWVLWSRPKDGKKLPWVFLPPLENDLVAVDAPLFISPETQCGGNFVVVDRKGVVRSVSAATWQEIAFSFGMIRETPPDPVSSGP